MAEITASLVKELREKTGAGMMDCKKALSQTAGEIEAAIDWLRTKGLAAAAKKAGRVAAEGLVAVATSGKAGAVVEVNSETDFVARNERFQQFAATLAELALSGDSTVEALKSAQFPGAGHDVATELTSLVATIGENMNLRRAAKLSVSDGVVASYVHSPLVKNVGKIGVLVALESTAPVDKLQELGRQIAMHVAAARPDALHIADIDPAALEREKAVQAEKAAAEGKPAHIIEKMMEGRIRKYYEEVVLHEQLYVVDGESKVRDVIAKAAKDLGHPIVLAGFVRMALGEGIEKETTDFAAEVAATLIH